MTQEELKKRTKDLTIAVIPFVKGLANGKGSWNIGDQLCRAGASVGANYRAASANKTLSNNPKNKSKIIIQQSTIVK